MGPILDLMWTPFAGSNNMAQRRMTWDCMLLAQGAIATYIPGTSVQPITRSATSTSTGLDLSETTHFGVPGPEFGPNLDIWTSKWCKSGLDGQGGPHRVQDGHPHGPRRPLRGHRRAIICPIWALLGPHMGHIPHIPVWHPLVMPPWGCGVWGIWSMFGHSGSADSGVGPNGPNWVILGRRSGI